MITPQWLPGRFYLRFSRIVLAGACRLTPDPVECCPSTWSRIVRDFRLVAAHPFGQPTHWQPNPNGSTVERARLVVARSEAIRRDRQERRNANRVITEEQRLARKIRRARNAGVIA